MKLLEEFQKALRGEPSRVKLRPATPDEIAVENGFRALGYLSAFGTGFGDGSRRDLLKGFLKLDESKEAPEENLLKVSAYINNQITASEFNQWFELNERRLEAKEKVLEISDEIIYLIK